MKPRSTLALLAVVIAGVAAWLFWNPEAAESVSPDGTSPAAPPPAAAGLTDEGDASQAGTLSRAAASSPAIEDAGWATPSDRERDLHGIVLGPDGAPFAGATLIAWRPFRQHRSTLDLPHRHDREEIARTTSRADGRFRIPLERGSLHDLDAFAGALRAPLVKGCRAGERVVVRLEAAGAVTGTITHAETGDPVEGVRVETFRAGGPGRRMETSTDADGRYSVDGLTSGRWYLDVAPATLQPPGWVDLHVAPGERLVRDFALKTGSTARGRVTDASTGKPIEGAEVSHTWVFDRVARTDADGRYELPGLDGESWSRQLHARASGHGRLAKNLAGMKGDVECDFALPPAQVVTGSVVDALGSPLPDVYVAVAAAEMRDEVQQIDWQTARTGADGGFRIENVRSDVPHALYLRKRGLGTLLYELGARETQSNEVDVGVLRMAPAGWIAGTVHDDSGEPVAGQTLELIGWNADRTTRFEDARAIYGVNHYVGRLEARTDDLGRFRFDDLAAGSYTLTLERGGREQIEPRELVVQEGRGREDVALLISAGGVIAGSVVRPDGVAEEGVRVLLHAEGQDGRAWAEQYSDRDGRFRFTGVADGSYVLVARPRIRHDVGAGARFLMHGERVTVVPGQTDVRLPLRWARRTTGVVYDASGEPVARTMVRARDADGERVMSVVTDEHGRFAMTLPETAVVDLFADPTSRQHVTENGSRIFHVPHQEREDSASLRGVAAGATDVVLRLPAQD